MNKVFKIIWSQVLKSWVVASELSKSKTKSKSSVANKTALITLSALTGLAGSAYAQQGVGGGQATGGSNGTAISACNGKQNQAQAIGNHAIAIGCEAEANNNANSNNATNIQLVNRHNPGNPQVGQEYLMVNAASTAIGYRAKALNASIAFGDNAQATNVGIAIGLGAESLNNSAIALGSLAQAKGNTSFALGRQSVAENDFSTAIGNVAYAKSESSIAMGHSATAEGYRAIAIGAADSKNAPGDGVSRGAGYQVNSQTLAKGEDSIAFGGGANATQRDALAIGAFSKSSGAKAVAIGTGSNAGAAEAVAIGQGATALTEGGVALGRGAKVNEVGSIALGQNSATSVSNEQGYLTNTAAPKSIVSVGSTGNERRIQHVSAGAKDTDAVNVSQLKAVHNIASKGWNVTTQGTGSTNVAPGGTVDFSNTDGNIVVSKTNNNIQLNLDKKITADEITINNGGPVVNKKGINLNNTKIINLVEGVADGDAVNVKQLTNNINQVTNHLTAKGLNFSANNGGVVHRDLGTELAIKGEATTEGTFSGGNLKTVAKPDGSINIQMADAPKFGDITINNDGRITGVKDGVD
ncbi:MAG: ESPR-type extended signal peptide-containing protein, partial [Neisseriaceae bacterium]